MVRKLFKHELLFYWRLMVPLLGALLGIALLGRITQLFESESVVYSIVNTSSIVMFVIAILACLILTTIFCVVRFYKNLFTGEGYLTFTLPATPTGHLVVKLLTAVLVNIVTVIGILASACVIIDTEVLIEIGKAAGYLWGLLGESLGANRVHLTLYFLEFLVLFLVSLFYELLLFYLCIAIGQLFRKNRVLAAVGIYFAYSITMQILGTVISGIISSFINYRSIMELIQFIGKNPYTTVHILLGGFLLFYAGLATAFFFLTRWIIHRKLNLE